MAAFSAEKLVAECRDIGTAYVREHGHKRGLHLFGQFVGGERRARAIYAGEVRRVWAEEYLSAVEARAALARAKAARLRAELHELEATYGMGAGAARGGASGAGPGDGGRGGVVHHPLPPMAPA